MNTHALKNWILYTSLRNKLLLLGKSEAPDVFTSLKNNIFIKNVRSFKKHLENF